MAITNAASIVAGDLLVRVQPVARSAVFRDAVNARVVAVRPFEVAGKQYVEVALEGPHNSKVNLEVGRTVEVAK